MKFVEHKETAKDKDGKDRDTLTGFTVHEEDEDGAGHVMARVSFEDGDTFVDFVRPVTVGEAEAICKELRAKKLK